MADDSVWSFISYAHDDNLPTGGGQDEEGFVSFLQRMLDVKLKDLGAQQAKLWRDSKRFSDGDPFDVEIEDALKKSALLIVVMSRNWLSRPYCKKELDDFIRYRQGAGVANVEERIVVVCKQYVPKENRPAPLQVQEGFAFYERDPQDDVAGEKPFFNLGKPTDERQFFDVRDGLAILIQKRISRLSAGPVTDTTVRPEVTIAKPNGRTVYLAKPATDMEQAYNRLALELQARGYAITPDVSSNIPNTGAAAYVDDALAKSELSIHLVGEKGGFAPDDDDAPRIVKLQLMRARARAAAGAPADAARFRRVVWAPKVLEAASPTAAPAGERDPIEAFLRFDEQSPSDMIEGDVLNKFLESLFQYLTETATRRPPPPPTDGLEVFLDFNPQEDEEYGLALATALNNGPISIVIPAAGEPAQDARNFNRDKLAKCDGVVLCWGRTSEVWVRAEADRLSRWQDLGRTQQFVHCSMVVGPPPAPRKKALNLLFPKNQFDRFVDLADKSALTADMLIDLGPVPKAAQP